MGAIGHDGLAVPGRVELAHEPPFRLGILEVEPATRQLIGDGRSETLEPRVMQVLVALHRAGGIVTRDELTDRCWGGRVVGDDAINRIISRIRHLAVDIGQDSFQVETITKVGYRLVASDQAPVRADAPPGAATTAERSRRGVIGALVASGATAIVGVPLAWRILGQAGRPPPEAEELYDRALVLRNSTSDDDQRQVIAYLKEAVRIAPDYGEAWGALALAYRSSLIIDPPEQVAGFDEKLREAIEQADRYASNNADAAIARRLHQLFFGRWAVMEPLYRDLGRLYPSHPTGHYLLGSLLMDVGRWNDAVAVLRKAKATNPLAPMPRYKLTVSLWSAGRLSQAEQELDEASRWSAHGAIWFTRLKLLAMTGRPQASLAIVEDAVVRPAEADEEFLTGWRLFLAALITRAPADVDKSLASLVDWARRDTGPPVPQAFQCALLGEKALALDILEGCYLGIGEWASKKSADPNGMAAHPMFQPQGRSLWSEPRFARILEGIGLERYWRETRTLPDYRRA